MIKVITDRHQKMFYRTAALEIAAHGDICSGTFYQI